MIALSDGLVSLYQEIFSEPPYSERYSAEEVKKIFSAYFREGVLLLKYLDNSVIGFSAALPFERSPLYDTQIVHEENRIVPLSKKFLKQRVQYNLHSIWYVSDIGVKQDYRGQNFGSELLSNLLAILQKGTVVLLRTSQGNRAAQVFYHHRFGFHSMNLATDISQLRQDGTIRIDRRIIMCKVIE